jgi:hypothetical protein
MSLAEAIRERLIKKRNERGLFLLSNGLFLLVGVLSSVDLSDLSQLKVSSWIAIGLSFVLLLAGCGTFVYYHMRARSFSA